MGNVNKLYRKYKIDQIYQKKVQTGKKEMNNIQINQKTAENICRMYEQKEKYGHKIHFFGRIYKT